MFLPAILDLSVTGRIPQREITENESRHAAVFNNILGAAHDNRWNIVCFQVTRGQAHGLMADGSVGGDDRCIHLVFVQHGQYIGAVLFNGRQLAAVGRCPVKPG